MTSQVEVPLLQAWFILIPAREGLRLHLAWEVLIMHLDWQVKILV